MAEIKNLPFFWDEIQEDKYRDMLSQVMHEASDGVQKARNISGTRTQKRGEWELMIAAASNKSFREYLHNKEPNHAAKIARVLEWKVDRIDNGPGQMDDADATALLVKLHRSYGMMGLKYAHFLAMNHVAIAAEIKAKSKSIQRSLGIKSLNRYWLVGVTILSLAAKYAQQMGVDVDPAEIEKFLVGVLQENITNMANYGMAGGVVDNTEMILARYFKLRSSDERMIWTNYMHKVKGKPPRPVVILKGPTQPRNTQGGIEVRWAVENKECIIAQRDFESWCKQPGNGFSISNAINGLEKEFNAKFAQRLQLASGTVHAGGGELREPCIVIPIPDPDSPLWSGLMRYTDPHDREAFEREAQPREVVTGFEVTLDDDETENSETGLGTGTPDVKAPKIDPATGLATPESVQAFVEGATRG